MPDKKTITQYAALPYRVEHDGQPLVCLVTSRETKRWILPKGQVEPKLKPHQVAENEAFEEAGLIGQVHAQPLATFPSIKRQKSGKEIPAEVVVYALEVAHVLDNWPERKQRDRRWMSPGEAAMVVGEPGLVQVLLDFGARWL